MICMFLIHVQSSQNKYIKHRRQINDNIWHSYECEYVSKTEPQSNIYIIFIPKRFSNHAVNTRVLAMCSYVGVPINILIQYRNHLLHILSNCMTFCVRTYRAIMQHRISHQ